MTLEQLKTRTRKDLATLARQRQIAGWHSMRKDDLIWAIFAVEGTGSSRSARHYYVTSNGNSSTSGLKTTQPASSSDAQNHLPGKRVAKNNAPEQPASVSAQKSSSKSINRNRLLPTAATSSESALEPDTLKIDSCDSDWLRVSWNLSEQSIKRAEAALKFEAHSAVPVLRLCTVTDSASQSSGRRSIVADHEVPGAKSKWYLPAPQFDQTYQVSLGYKTAAGDFRPIMHSNLVTVESTLRKNGSPSLDHAGDADCRNIPHSNGQQKLSTPPAVKVGRTTNKHSYVVLGGEKFLVGDDVHEDASENVRFEMQAELLIQGVVDPAATLTLDGEPVAIDVEGRFSARYDLPTGRQMISAVMLTPDEAEQRTLIMGVDRSMRELEPRRLRKKLV